MASWLLKAAIQGTIALLPQAHRINYIFQRNLTKRLRLKEPYFEGKLTVARRHLQNYQRVRPDSPAVPPDVLELGTGWLPIVPISLFLHGVDIIRSVDITPLLNQQLIRETLEMFVKYADEGRLTRHLLHVQPERLDTLRRVAAQANALSALDLLKQLRIEVVVADASKLDLPAESLTLIMSNTTLEHISPEIMTGIFRAFRRVIRRDGVMSHLIDLTDHYSHLDRNITPYNFLQFSELTWRLFNNRLQYQNRLRASDYRRVHQETGFEIKIEENRSATEEQFRSVKLAPAFARYTTEDAMVIESWMVSVPS